MAERLEFERIADSIATISYILRHRFQCVECNQCEPCGQVFMEALETLTKAGNVAPAARGQERA